MQSPTLTDGDNQREVMLDSDTTTAVLSYLENADAETAKEVQILLSKAKTLESRLPDHHEQLKHQSADLLGVDPDTVGDILAAAPSDPRLV